MRARDLGWATAAVLILCLLVGCNTRVQPKARQSKDGGDDIPPLVTTDAPAAPANATATAPVAVGTATNNAGNQGTTPTPPASDLKLPTLPAAASIAIDPFDPNWTPNKKNEQTVARLKKISLAIREYVQKEGRFPAAPGDNVSWRVRLLPYLGHADQLARFKLDEPWTSAANQAAALDVPPEYQWPEAASGRTCILAPRGPNTVFATPGGVDPSQFTDPWQDTIELVAVDPERAVQWSKPVDFLLSPGENAIGSLGQTAGGFLVAMANGDVRWIATTADSGSLAALFSINGREKVDRAAVTSEPMVVAKSNTVVPTTPAANTEPPLVAPPDGSATASIDALLHGPAKIDTRSPTPDLEDIDKAKALLKTVFKQELELLKKSDKAMFKEMFAKTLMDNKEKVTLDAAQYFVLLQAARDNAAEAGDFRLASDAAKGLMDRYQVDDYDLRRRTVLESSKALVPYYANQNEDLRKESESVLRLAIERDDFAVAKELFAVFQEATRRSGNRMEIARLQAAEKQLDDIKKAYQPVPPAIQVLSESPDDPTANYTVGAYLCLVKLRWTQGSLLLAKGSNLKLKVLATEDMTIPSGPLNMIQLADEMWELSDREAGVFKRGLQLRAVYWYRKALPLTTGGFGKVQAERRSEEANRIYGEKLVKEAMDFMDPVAPVRTATAD